MVLQGVIESVKLVSAKVQWIMEPHGSSYFIYILHVHTVSGDSGLPLGKQKDRPNGALILCFDFLRDSKHKCSNKCTINSIVIFSFLLVLHGSLLVHIIFL